MSFKEEPVFPFKSFPVFVIPPLKRFSKGLGDYIVICAEEFTLLLAHIAFAILGISTDDIFNFDSSVFCVFPSCRI